MRRPSRRRRDDPPRSPEVRWGHARAGDTTTPRLVPFAVALEMLRPTTRSAQPGQRLGLLNRVVPAGGATAGAEAAERLLALGVRAPRRPHAAGINAPGGAPTEMLLSRLLAGTADQGEAGTPSSSGATRYGRRAGGTSANVPNTPAGLDTTPMNAVRPHRVAAPKASSRSRPVDRPGAACVHLLGRPPPAGFASCTGRRVRWR